MKVTYIENGVRSTRECDALQYWNIKSPIANAPVLIYNDVEDDFDNPQYRTNILTPGTIIERVE
jgi:hypothetical protein